MKVFDIGRVCVKTAGKEKGMLAVVVDVVDDKFVIVDGEVKRRKCNIKHLKPSDVVLSVKNLKSKSKEEIKKLLQQHGFVIKQQQSLTERFGKKKQAKKQEQAKEKKQQMQKQAKQKSKTKQDK